MDDRDQVKTEYIGASYFLQSREFARGVDDVRAGRPARFDDYAWDQGGMPATDRQWAYEKGQQFATIAPRSMPLRINGKLNLDALRLCWWRPSIAETSRREERWHQSHSGGD